MFQLRKFTQRNTEFQKLHTQILAISVDDTAHGRTAWDKAALRQFPVLSDPGARVIRSCGLLQAGGDDGKSDDIAIRTTLLVDEKGREEWRRVSETANDFPRATGVLEQLRADERAVSSKGDRR